MTRALAIAVACLVAAVLVLSGLLRHEHKEAVLARSERDAALTAVKLAEATTHIVERYHETETVIREEAEPAIQQIEEAQGAESPIPDPVLGAWRDGIVSLREPASDADDPDSDTPR